jgi:hypothetical protein
VTGASSPPIASREMVTISLDISFNIDRFIF